MAKMFPQRHQDWRRYVAARLRLRRHFNRAGSPAKRDCLLEACRRLEAVIERDTGCEFWRFAAMATNEVNARFPLREAR